MAYLKAVNLPMPDPPYPATTKANGWKPEVDWQRIKSSKTWRLCPPEQRNNLLRLWLESWNEVPAGSWENDGELIAAAIDMPERIFTAHRDQLMRGWYLCSDNRLYHPVIVEMVLEMSSKRRITADRVKRHRAKNVTRNNDNVTRYQRVSNAQEQEQEQEQDNSPVPEHERKDGRSAKTSSESRGTRFSIPSIPDEYRDLCEKRRPDLDPVMAFEKFADYWKAVPGSKGVKADWLATWRNFLKNEYGNGVSKQSSNGVKHGRESDHDRIKRTNDELLARARAAASLG